MLYINSALAEEASGMQGVVDQVGDIIESAGDKAGNFLSGLPMLTTRLLMAALAIFIGCIVIRVGRRMVASVVKMRGQKSMKSAAQLSTVRSLVTSIFNYIMYFIIITVTLSIFNVNVSSLLAVAGVGGIAISFGAQTLVKDIISGIFIWLEGSIAVGDVVTINSLSGVVGLETAFPALYTGLVRTGKLGLERLAEALTEGPRRRFGFPETADFCVWELERDFTVDPAEFLSMGRATPFAGMRLWGRCAATVCGGRLVWNGLEAAEKTIF